MRYGYFTALLLIVAFGAYSQAIIDKPTFSEIMEKVLSSKFDSAGPGCVFLAAKNGDVIFQRAYGKANLELGIPMSSSHKFRIASLTKQFTAVAILQLEEKGKLSVNDNIKKYLPDFPTHDQEIRIANLLSHTSGIKNVTELKLPTEANWKPYTPMELICLFKDEPLDFEPGTDFHYSNSNYILLGYIIEKVSGLTYEQYLINNIFKPLGMEQAGYDHDEVILKGRASGYDQAGDNGYQNAAHLNTTFPYAAGSLVMTVDDLNKWNNGLQQNKVLKRESLVKATTRFILKNGKQTDYGFGWSLQELAGKKTSQHSGSINGFSSFEIYLPEEKIYIVALSNGSNKNTTSTSILAASILANMTSIKSISLPETTISKYVGTYVASDNAGIKFGVEKENGRLYFRDPHFQTPCEIHFRNPSEFFCYELFPINYVFSFDNKGDVDGFVVKISDMEAKIVKVK